MHGAFGKRCGGSPTPLLGGCQTCWLLSPQTSQGHWGRFPHQPSLTCSSWPERGQNLKSSLKPLPAAPQCQSCLSYKKPGSLHMPSRGMGGLVMPAKPTRSILFCLWPHCCLPGQRPPESAMRGVSSFVSSLMMAA